MIRAAAVARFAEAGVTAVAARAAAARIADRCTPDRTLLAYSWSCFRVSCCEVQPLQVGCPGPV
jgi:hypothetical protein